MRDDPTGRGEPEALGLVVELPPKQTSLRSRNTGAGIDPHSLHRREIDDDTVIAHGSAGDVVTASSHRNHELAFAREPDRGDDVGDAGAARDESRAAIDRSIPDAPRGVVWGIARAYQLAAEVPLQVSDGRIVKRCRAVRFGLECLGRGHSHLLTHAHDTSRCEGLESTKNGLAAVAGCPYPAARMKGYGQFCPVAKAAEIVAERWSPLVLRELICGSHRFSDLHRGVPRMSRTLLAQRLQQLEDAGIVRSVARTKGRGREYFLTSAGEELRPVIERLGEWGQRWARSQISAYDLDPGLLMWDIHRRVSTDRLPDRRVVVRFDFRGVPKIVRGSTTFWLILQQRDVDMCLKDPGFEVDVVVDADLAAMTKVWMGDVRLGDVRRAGLIRLDGRRELVRAFPEWLALSGFAGVERPQAVVAG